MYCLFKMIINSYLLELYVSVILFFMVVNVKY